MSVAVVLNAEMVLVSLKYRSVTIKMYLLPCDSFGKDPTLYIASWTSGADDETATVYASGVLWGVSCAA